jgi:hypothetical protein
MALAISSGVPRRRVGIVLVMTAAICSGVAPCIPPSRVMIGVSVMPGLITLTRICLRSNSTESERANDRTADFAAMSIEVNARPCLSASAEPTRITDAPSRRCGRAFWKVKNADLKRMPQSSPDNASDRCSTGANSAMPALTTRMSIFPKRWLV